MSQRDAFPTKDAALREDVHKLGALVGEMLREQGGEALFQAGARAPGRGGATGGDRTASGGRFAE
ncbi:MAG TPA: hypothetical protein VH988_06695 [Thermoanaerobaculia bacterium]|nr:hypothetical protein [Thermoanaerobaculia bacterium]